MRYVNIKERSILNIPVPTDRRKNFRMEALDMELHPRKTKRRGSFILWLVAILILCIAVGVVFTYFFAGATIRGYPKHETVTLSQETEAYSDGPSNELSFRSMTVERLASRMI